jgi:prepilin signal peptidase PulO-like enzyme (type II secretory pathway)
MQIEIIPIFILGLLVGSFLNCVIWRTNKKQSFLKGRSYCPHCKHPLEWYDLFPVFSFVFLKGRCRYCKKPISKQYPLVELGVGLLFVFTYLQTRIDLLGPNLSYNLYHLVFLWAIISIFTIIFAYDLKHYMIPDEITVAGLIVAVTWLGFNFYLKLFSFTDLFFYLFSAIGAAIFFFCFWFFSHGKAMGFGDVKLAFLLGLILGWPNIIAGLFISFLLGGIMGIILIALKKRKLKSAVPFGPFLVVGTLVAIFYGTSLMNWYLSLSFKR